MSIGKQEAAMLRKIEEAESRARLATEQLEGKIITLEAKFLLQMVAIEEELLRETTALKQIQKKIDDRIIKLMTSLSELEKQLDEKITVEQLKEKTGRLWEAISSP